MKQRLIREASNLGVKTVNHVYSRFHQNHKRHRPMEIVYERAAQQSADFIMANMDNAVLFDDRNEYWHFVLDGLPNDGLLMECGVFEGQSINLMADHLASNGDKRVVHGFDSFEGLEEHWAGEALPKGFFDLGGKLPDVRPGVQLYKGWVQETVSPFLAEHPGQPLGLLHIDTDTYTPARYLLDEIKPRLVSGSIIAFDELIGYPNWQKHEYKALQEVLGDDGYEFIAFTSRQAAIRILS